jgi:hypothetical protein
MTRHAFTDGLSSAELAVVEAIQRSEDVADLVPPEYLHLFAKDAAPAALRVAYWKLREHASGYRGAEVFRRSMEAYQADRSDPLKARKALTHEFYARGIEAAARTVAELLGEPEHEIQEGGPTHA